MQEHGYFTIEINEQTLIVNCYESWNIETVLRLCQEYKEQVAQIYDKPRACLVDLSQWELATPDMWDEINKLNHWGNWHNQKYEAVICNMSIQKKLMVDSHAALTNVETAFFENKHQAHQWLSQLGLFSMATAKC